ncbi:MAG TPA: hypothetical protein VHB98_08665 [Chloroflexota bacterium]|nr:hypothetical protein [Chloroflexota bacterium]
MWEYNALLTLRRGPPVISVALLPFTATGGIELARYTEEVFGQEYTKLQYWRFALRGLNAEEYLAAGPVLAAALATLMRPGAAGRVTLKISALERLAASDLDEARKFLLLNFIETYLQLTGEEQAQLRSRIQVEGKEEVEALELTWADRLRLEGRAQGVEQGIEQGRLAAKREDVLHLVRLRFGAAPAALAHRVATADGPVLDRMLERAVQVAGLDEFMASLETEW